MLKNYSSLKFAIVFLLLSFACVLAYNAAGSYVDNEGYLQEKFGFIPLAWVFFCLSSCCAIFALFVLMKRPINDEK